MKTAVPIRQSCTLVNMYRIAQDRRRSGDDDERMTEIRHHLGACGLSGCRCRKALSKIPPPGADRSCAGVGNSGAGTSSVSGPARSSYSLCTQPREAGRISS